MRAFALPQGLIEGTPGFVVLDPLFPEALKGENVTRLSLEFFLREKIILRQSD
jgi:hypothetical protein